MNIKETAKQVHQIAVEHGFWEDTEKVINTVSDKGKEVVKSMVFAQKIALIHSELSEALEADRKGKRANVKAYENDSRAAFPPIFKDYIKDTVEDEIADAVIRIMDLCEWMGIDIEWHIEKKMQYNSTREYKHGKSY